MDSFAALGIFGLENLDDVCAFSKFGDVEGGDAVVVRHIHISAGIDERPNDLRFATGTGGYQHWAVAEHFVGIGAGFEEHLYLLGAGEREPELGSLAAAAATEGFCAGGGASESSRETGAGGGVGGGVSGEAFGAGVGASIEQEADGF